MVVVRTNLRQLTNEKNIAYTDLLWQYIVEDFLYRLQVCGASDVLWLSKEMSQYKVGEHINLYLVFDEEKSDRSDGADESDSATEKRKRFLQRIKSAFLLGAGMEGKSDVVWHDNTGVDEHKKSFDASLDGQKWSLDVTHGAGVDEQKWSLDASYDVATISFPVTITFISNEDAQIPVRQEIKTINRSFKVLSVNAYSPEAILAECVFEILEKLELISDMKPYAASYMMIKNNSVSGRRILEVLQTKIKKKPKVLSKRRLEQIKEYRSYAYMRKRWQQYCKRNRVANVNSTGYANSTEHGNSMETSWEEALDLLVSFIEPLWNALLEGSVFLDDWMPELGRFLG